MVDLRSDLARVRGMGRRLAEGSSGAELLEAVAAGLAVQDKDLPVIERARRLLLRHAPA